MTNCFNFKKYSSPRIRKILRLRYVEKKLYEEVAKELGVTRERIRQLEGDAISALIEDLINFQVEQVAYCVNCRKETKDKLSSGEYICLKCNSLIK